MPASHTCLRAVQASAGRTGQATRAVGRLTVLKLSVFARHGATHQDDAGGIPGEKPIDERHTLESRRVGQRPAPLRAPFCGPPLQ